MIHHTQACKLAAIVFFAAIFSGCSGSENERGAKITGTVDTSKANMSPTEAKGNLRGVAPGTKPKGYPGAK